MVRVTVLSSAVNSSNDPHALQDGLFLNTPARSCLDGPLLAFTHRLGKEDGEFRW